MSFLLKSSFCFCLVDAVPYKHNSDITLVFFGGVATVQLQVFFSPVFRTWANLMMTSLWQILPISQIPFQKLVKIWWRSICLARLLQTVVYQKWWCFVQHQGLWGEEIAENGLRLVVATHFFLNFYPDPLGDDPIWSDHIFQMGAENHQLDCVSWLPSNCLPSPRISMIGEMIHLVQTKLLHCPSIWIGRRSGKFLKFHLELLNFGNLVQMDHPWM